MELEPKSISDQIDCLARLTGAPKTFIFQVRELFLRKGISLEADASPYVKALEEAFQREESIRTSARNARKNVQRLEKSFGQLGQTYARQIEQLKRIQAGLNDQARRLRTGRPAELGANPAGSRAAGRVQVRGNRRSLVTRQQNEDLPMVPGPEDLQ